MLLVDADPQGTALRWSEQGGFALSCLALPVKDLHSRLGGIVGDRYDLVVIDTPPLAERAGIVLSALRLADLVVVPLAPTIAEYERLGDVWQAVNPGGCRPLLPVHPDPNTACMVGHSIHAVLGDAFAAAEKAMHASLCRTTLDSLVQEVLAAAD